MIKCLTLLTVLAIAPSVVSEDIYTQHEDLVYGESHGAGLLMDVFIPKDTKNGLAIVDVASGAWHSDRGKIRDHKRAQMYDIYCGRGYTVFAIRPGSRTRFTAEDMLSNIYQGIRHVKFNADKYEIDPNRLGLTGASAGGHLASLAAVRPSPENPKGKGVARFDTAVAAVGVFFPPTHFLMWGDQKTPFSQIGALLFSDGIGSKTEDEIKKQATKISPALQINGTTPPFLIWHGDADPLVPLQQSKVFVNALNDSGNEATLKIKPGGAHPWLTIPEEIKDMADWFDSKLVNK